MRIAVITPGKGRLKYPYVEVISGYKESRRKSILDKWDEEHALIDALYTDNKTPLPVGEYEVDLIWQYWNGEYEKWISLPEERKAMYANSFWEFSKFAVKTQQVYIASVAPESKYLQQLEDGEDTRTPHEEYLDAIIDNRKKNGVYPFDNKQPDSIEQVAESVEEAAENFSSETLHGFLSPQYQGFIAGSEWKANHIKQTHVPIASVITLIENYKSDIIDGQPQGYSTKEYLDIIVRGIKNLIK